MGKNKENIGETGNTLSLGESLVKVGEEIEEKAKEGDLEGLKNMGKELQFYGNLTKANEEGYFINEGEKKDSTIKIGSALKNIVGIISNKFNNLV